MKDQVLMKQDDTVLAKLLSNTDEFLRKEYLSNLEKAEIVPVPKRLQDIKLGSNLRLFRITSLSYRKNEELSQSLTMIYRALCESVVNSVLILDSDKDSVNLYWGVAGSEVQLLGTIYDTFQSSFTANFPGARIERMKVSDNEKLLDSIFGDANVHMASVSASLAASDGRFHLAAGLDMLVDGMRGKPFSLILVAKPNSYEQVTALRRNLEAMYTQISPFKSQSVTLSDTQTESTSTNVSLALNASESASTTESENVSISTGTTHSESKNINQEKNQKKQAQNQLIGAGASLAMILGGMASGTPLPLAEATPKVLQGLFFGNALSGILGSARTLFDEADQNNNVSDGISETKSISISTGETKTLQSGYSMTKGSSQGNSGATGKTLNITAENKTITGLLELIDMQLARVRRIEETGGMECAAYIIAGSTEATLSATNIYRSMLTYREAAGCNTAINQWRNQQDISTMFEYLSKFEHPVFHFNTEEYFPDVSAATLISSDEMPLFATLPQKSLPGLPTSSHAEFSRDTNSQYLVEGNSVKIGTVYHLGKPEITPVHLNVNDLCGHLFVCGSPGMGKSNFCYGLLEELRSRGVHFMVIEPAKGEYRNVFGGLSDVQVFGANPNLYPLLRINPFVFPNGIHVQEHIDRLMGIFSACWPLYAAMPAILKEALEEVYHANGYDLIGGGGGNGTYPTFAYLLNTLPKIIKNAHFSGEVESNYIGALVTRVKSLTSGLFSNVFCAGEIDESVLFNSNVVIDLSRVGSSETKALIMGVLVMRLQEYHMAKGEMNSPLRHVTVLEEAHHLLRGNGRQIAQGESQVQALSIEMITNAIAEMRTYGEGFIIADQSPSAVDLAVIRNTNAKVSFKLPERSDRSILGETISLDDEQIKELSRLERGVAAVFQSNWENAVLCKITHMPDTGFAPFVYHPEVITRCDEKLNVGPLLAELLEERLSTQGFSNFKRFCYRLLELIKPDQILACDQSRDDLPTWEKEILERLSNVYGLNEAQGRELISMCINIQVSNGIEKRPFWYQYAAYRKLHNSADSASENV